jgi:hypothetical protein
MYRLAIFFSGGADEAAELQDRVAALMCARSRAAPRPETAGYVVALEAVAEPPDDDAFVALVSEGAQRVLVGPPELL